MKKCDALDLNALIVAYMRELGCTEEHIGEIKTGIDAGFYQRDTIGAAIAFAKMEYEIASDAAANGMTISDWREELKYRQKAKEERCRYGVTKERVEELESYFWSESNDPETEEWRKELTDQEAAMVDSWDERVGAGFEKMLEKIAEAGVER